MDSASLRLQGARQWLSEWRELTDPIPEPTAPPPRPTRLCVAMATYDDFDGVWFTISSVLLHHPEIADQVSFVVIDNHPTSPASTTLKLLDSRIPRLRYVPFRSYKGTVVRDLVFREAQADIVCCVDSHVLLRPGALAALLRYFDALPDSKDMVQGPLMGANPTSRPATHFVDEWGAAAFGRWGFNGLADDFGEQPYELRSQGLGVFAMRKDAWPGFNPLLRGYGSEEGYLHERVRRNGGRTVGLPALAWVHRFHRPHGTPYPAELESRLRNYEIGWAELGWDLTKGRAHFREKGLSEQAMQRAREAVFHPDNRYDAIVAFNDDTDPQGWADAQEAARQRGIVWRLERVSTGRGTPVEQRDAVGWRALAEQATRRGLRNVARLQGTELIEVTAADFPRLISGDGP